MPYVTHAKLAESIGAHELTQVASDEDAPPVKVEILNALLRGLDTSTYAPLEVQAGVRAIERIDAQVIAADALIDGYLAKRGYALPLVPVHILISAWSTAITRYNLHKNRLVGDGKDPVERAYRDALRLLGEVAAGRFALGLEDAVAVDKLDARFHGSASVFGRKSGRGWR